jgi:hypothetical protein
MTSDWTSEDMGWMISWQSRQEKTSRVGHEHIVGTEGDHTAHGWTEQSREPVLNDTVASSRRLLESSIVECSRMMELRSHCKMHGSIALFYAERL